MHKILGMLFLAIKALFIGVFFSVNRVSWMLGSKFERYKFYVKLINNEQTKVVHNLSIKFRT